MNIRRAFGLSDGCSGEFCMLSIEEAAPTMTWDQASAVTAELVSALEAESGSRDAERLARCLQAYIDGGGPWPDFEGIPLLSAVLDHLCRASKAREWLVYEVVHQTGGTAEEIEECMAVSMANDVHKPVVNRRYRDLYQKLVQAQDALTHFIGGDQ